MSDQSMAEKRQAMREKTRKGYEAILTLAGISWSHVWELANDYWPDHESYDDVRLPWWLFQTNLGLIRFGWRKRVLEIDWSATTIRRIVTTDEVTKDEGMVHAYSTEKAVEYMKELAR